MLFLLQQALDLGVEYPEQALKHPGAVLPEKFIPDHAHQGLNFLLRSCHRHGLLPLQPQSETVVGGPFAGKREPGIIVEVIGVGVEHAVGEDRRAAGHLQPHQDLQRVGDPEIAQGLIDILRRKCGIEIPNPGEELSGSVQEAGGEGLVKVEAGAAAKRFHLEAGTFHRLPKLFRIRPIPHALLLGPLEQLRDLFLEFALPFRRKRDRELGRIIRGLEPELPVLLSEIADPPLH